MRLSAEQRSDVILFPALQVGTRSRALFHRVLASSRRFRGSLNWHKNIEKHRYRCRPGSGLILGLTLELLSVNSGQPGSWHRVVEYL